MNQLFKARQAVFLTAGIGAAGFGVNHFIQQRDMSSIEAETVEAALSPKEYKPFKLVLAKPLTPNTKSYTFEFPDKDMVSGLHTASLLMARATIDGKEVSRPYTPVSRNSDKGSLELVIKTYPAPGGVMSRHIDSLKVGDELELKGPYQKIDYKPNMKKKIGMIAGGTGITPMYQVIREILDNPADKTEISLVFANVSRKDIILRDEIDALAHLHPNFKVHYTVDKAPIFRWNGSKGFVTKEMVEKHIAGVDEDVLVMVCGPKGFMKHVSGDKGKNKSQGEVEGLLKEIGYTSEQVFKF